MTNCYLGEITVFGGNFAIYGWAFCNGQTLSISQQSALFSLLGTNYGGNGVSTFQLPNMQNNAPMHWGSGVGLSPYIIGETVGQEGVSLLTSQIPMHNHAVTGAVAGVASQKTGVPSASVWLGDSSPGDAFTAASTPVATFSTLGVSPSGSGGPHTNVQPILALNFLIAMTGVFPARN
jgi:microcystin-dependent protein